MFKAMTWNVENLFRPGGSSGPASDDVYTAKLEGLAATITAQAPDVVALQEVGDPGALDDLVAHLDGAWHQRLSTIPDARHIRVGWLSRHPVSDAQDIDVFPPYLQPVQSDDQGGTEVSMGRGAVAITLDLSAGPITLVTAHLKSKLLTFPNGRFAPTDEDERARFGAYALYRRAAEATTLRVWVTQALADRGQSRSLILMGDLNDTVQAATTQLLLGPPAPSSTPRDSTDPTKATTSGCGTWRRACQQEGTTRGSTVAARPHRPRPRLSRPRPTTADRGGPDRPADAIGDRRPHPTTRRAELGSCAHRRPVRHLTIGVRSEAHACPRSADSPTRVLFSQPDDGVADSPRSP